MGEIDFIHKKGRKSKTPKSVQSSAEKYKNHLMDPFLNKFLDRSQFKKVSKKAMDEIEFKIAKDVTQDYESK